MENKQISDYINDYVTFKSITQFSGVANRTEYFIGALFNSIFLALGSYLTFSSENTDLNVLGCCILALFLVHQVAYASRRCHDLGWSAGFVIILFIPILGIILGILLLILPGKNKNNTNSIKESTNNEQIINTNYFTVVAEEIKNNQYDEGLKLQAFAEHPNDENQAKALYIKLRVQQYQTKKQ